MIIIKHQKAVQATSHLPGWMMGTISVGIWIQGYHGALCQDLHLKTPHQMCYYKVRFLFCMLTAVHYILFEMIIDYPLRTLILRGCLFLCA